MDSRAACMSVYVHSRAACMSVYVHSRAACMSVYVHSRAACMNVYVHSRAACMNVYVHSRAACMNVHVSSDSAQGCGAPVTCVYGLCFVSDQKPRVEVKADGARYERVGGMLVDVLSVAPRVTLRFLSILWENNIHKIEHNGEQQSRQDYIPSGSCSTLPS
jgi:hypothetical protein